MKFLKELSWVVVIYCASMPVVIFITAQICKMEGRGEFCGMELMFFYPIFFFLFDLIEDPYGLYILLSAFLLSLVGAVVLGKIIKKKNPPKIIYYGIFFILLLILIAVGYLFRYKPPKLEEINKIAIEAGEEKSFDKCIAIEDKRGNEQSIGLQELCIHQAIIYAGEKSLCDEYVEYKYSDIVNGANKEYFKEECLNTIDESRKLSATDFCQNFPKDETGYSYECVNDKCSSVILNRYETFDNCYLENSRIYDDPEWCEMIEDQALAETCKKYKSTK